MPGRKNAFAAIRQHEVAVARLIIASVAVGVLGVLIGAGRMRQTPSANATSRPTPTPHFTRYEGMGVALSDVSSSQLDQLDIALTPVRGVEITADQADAIASAGEFSSEPIDQTVLATCSMARVDPGATPAWANRACWVVSFHPGFPILLFGDPAPGQLDSVPATAEVALVDAQTGKLFFQAATAAPASG